MGVPEPSAPITPEKDEAEERSAGADATSRSLVADFDSLALAPLSAAGEDAAPRSPSTASSASLPAVLADAAAEAWAERLPVGDDDDAAAAADEPILADNDERFCLLPVK